MKNQVEKQVQAEIEIQQAREKQEKENKKVVKDIGVSIIYMCQNMYKLGKFLTILETL